MLRPARRIEAQPYGQGCAKTVYKLHASNSPALPQNLELKFFPEPWFINSFTLNPAMVHERGTNSEL
jgi:hypothetical protein